MKLPQVQDYASAAGREMEALPTRLRLAAQRPRLSAVVKAKYRQVADALSSV